MGPGWLELAAAVRPLPVVVGLVFGQDRPQVPFAEDEHPVGDLRACGQDESFGESVRARAPRRDLYGPYPGTGQDSIERRGELPGAVADQEPEVRGVLAEVHQ